MGIMLPDFLGIGAQKAGTTWLWWVLRQHPNIWMPPIKELRHFNIRCPLPSITQLPRRPIPHQTATALKQIRLGQEVGWHLRFLLLPRTNRWYRSLFHPGPGQICGEITPSYATLSEAGVARVKALLPDTKIIYLLRNPVDRIWSQAAMYYRNRGVAIDTVDSSLFWEFYNKKKAARNSAYLENLRTWEHFYPPEQIFVGFLEEIAEDPGRFLHKILDFLELDHAPAAITDVGHVPNRRNSQQIPDFIARDLVQRHYAEFEQLHRRFDNPYTAEWLDYANKYVDRESG
jgi:hypothetical protein